MSASPGRLPGGPTAAAERADQAISLTAAAQAAAAGGADTLVAPDDSDGASGAAGGRRSSTFHPGDPHNTAAGRLASGKDAKAVTYFVAGLADDESFAEAERIGEMLAASLPSVSIRSLPLLPGEWRAFLASASEVLGTRFTETTLVWTVEGRVVGTLHEFASFAKDVYGFESDYSVHQLRVVADLNMREAEAGKRRAELAAKPGNRALIVVNCQQDFFKYCNGAAAVRGGDDVLATINALKRDGDWRAVVMTQQIVEPGHMSLASSHAGARPFTYVDMGGDRGKQFMWPDHCAEDSLGAAFHPYVDMTRDDIVVRTGAGGSSSGDDEAGSDAAAAREGTAAAAGAAIGSAFTTCEDAALEAALSAHRISTVYIVGVPLDVCVVQTALDAAKRGYDTLVVTDACAGFYSPGEDATEGMLEELEDAGVTILSALEVPKRAGTAS